MGAGNLMVATAIFFYGLTFTGISNLATLLNLAMFNKSSFLWTTEGISISCYTY